MLETFPDRFRQALRDAVFARLGVVTGELADDLALIARDRRRAGGGDGDDRPLLFDWRGGSLRATTDRYDGEAFAEVRAALARREAVPGALDHPYWSDAEPCSMQIEEVEAIWAAIDATDDWAPLHAKIAAVRRMGAALEKSPPLRHDSARDFDPDLVRARHRRAIVVGRGRRPRRGGESPRARRLVGLGGQAVRGPGRDACAASPIWSAPRPMPSPT